MVLCVFAVLTDFMFWEEGSVGAQNQIGEQTLVSQTYLIVRNSRSYKFRVTGNQSILGVQLTEGTE